MFRVNENKKWFGISVGIIVCLAIVGVVWADWVEQAKLLASGRGSRGLVWRVRFD